MIGAKPIYLFTCVNLKPKEQLPNTGAPNPVPALWLLNLLSLTSRVDTSDKCLFLYGELLSYCLDSNVTNAKSIPKGLIKAKLCLSIDVAIYGPS